MMTCDPSMYSSRASMASRSSTSRKIDTPGMSKESCRLMVAHWSCPVLQMWLRKRCHVMPLATVRAGHLWWLRSLMTGVFAACTTCCSATKTVTTSAIAIVIVMSVAITTLSRSKLFLSCCGR
eukprot:scaffold16850_cov58-Phaeocystis_antarctica.AAC.9